jgi:hypothetical protein
MAFENYAIRAGANPDSITQEWAAPMDPLRFA